MSSSFWWDNEYFEKNLLADTKPAATDTVFYVDSGDQPAPAGDDELQTIAVRDRLEKLGWTLNENLFYYLQKGGAHNEASWGARFDKPMGDLYSRRPVAPVE